MTIKLPMDVEIEMNTRLPYDFDDIIRKIFKEYLGEAKTENLDFNKLKFIDLCIASIRNSKDAKEAVQDIMLKQTEYRLRMLNQFPEKNSFFNMNFMAHYYEMGRASTLLHTEYSSNYTENETIMKVIIRIIKEVSDIEEQEYGEMEGVLCRNCCNFTTIAVDGKHHCKCKAYGITREANTNWRSKYEACGLYNTPIGNKYKPIFEGGNE